MKTLTPNKGYHFKLDKQIFEGVIYTPDEFDESRLIQITEAEYQKYISDDILLLEIEE